MILLERAQRHDNDLISTPVARVEEIVAVQVDGAPRHVGVLLDNTPHGNSSRPKGSASKMDAAEIVYTLRRDGVFRPDTEATVSIECVRSRFGGGSMRLRM